MLNARKELTSDPAVEGRVHGSRSMCHLINLAFLCSSLHDLQPASRETETGQGKIVHSFLSDTPGMTFNRTDDRHNYPGKQ